MNNRISRVKLFVKDTSRAFETKKIVVEELLNQGFTINENNYDIAMSIGGDGTFLKMLHSTNFNSNIYYTRIADLAYF